jgi:acetyl esterase/lipase
MQSLEQISLIRYLRLKALATIMRFAIAPIYFLQARQDVPGPGEEKRQRISIPSRDSGRQIDAFLYSPPGTTEENSHASSPASLLINWHSSGFVVPSLGTDRQFCAFIARTLGIVVLDVDYRKAPEFPFPAAYHDMEDVADWVALNQEKFDVNRIAVSGFSAGGTLALEAAALASNTDLNKYEFQKDGDGETQSKISIRAVIAAYPATDLSIDPATKQAPRPLDEVPPAMQNFFWDCYVPDKQSRSDPRVSPLYLEKSLFPSHVAIISCEGDNLHAEAVQLAQKLDDGSRTLLSHMLEGVGHGFDKGAKEGSQNLKMRDEMQDLIKNFLNVALG